MGKNKHQLQRVLGLAVSSRGFGYALFEGEKLVNWGFASTKQKQNVNAWCAKRIERMVKQYEPDVIVIESVFANGAVRSPRVRRLAKQIEVIAGRRQSRVKSFSKLHVIKSVCGTVSATRHDMADKVSKLYPNELSFRLPKRRGTSYPKTVVFACLRLWL